MKQRLTFLLPHGTVLNRDDIEVSSDSLTFVSEAPLVGKEWRTTLEWEELPSEVQDLLRDFGDFQVRWSTSKRDLRISPVVSRTPPGLHAFYAPKSSSDDARVCDFLNLLIRGGGIKCHSVSDSFSHPHFSNDRSVLSLQQYFAYAPLDQRFENSLFNRICASGQSNRDGREGCLSNFTNLDTPSFIDIDYNSGNRDLMITAYWTERTDPVESSSRKPKDRIVKGGPGDGRIEIGILHLENATEPDQFKVGGFLTVLGEDERPSATLFSFPSRHHPLPASLPSMAFRASFLQPTGLHPKLDLTFTSQRFMVAPRESCSLHAYLTLPSELFIDRYQFTDPSILQSQNLIALDTLTGEDDLEAPEWVIWRWGSAALFRLALPSSPSASPWTITIPTHLRYLNETTNGIIDSPGSSSLTIPWPVVFWACDAETSLSTNPFDRIHLGYDDLFAPDTVFYHIHPAPKGEGLFETVQVPVLDVTSAQYVPLGTLVVVTVGFLWVLWRLVRTVSTDTGSTTKQKTG